MTFKPKRLQLVTPVISINMNNIPKVIPVTAGHWPALANLSDAMLQPRQEEEEFKELIITGSIDRVSIYMTFLPKMTYTAVISTKRRTCHFFLFLSYVD